MTPRQLEECETMIGDLRVAIEEIKAKPSMDRSAYEIGRLDALVVRAAPLAEMLALAITQLVRVRAAARDQAARDRELIGQLENYVDLKPSRELLLEIAVAAVGYRKPIETEQDARDSLDARRRLDAALAKVARNGATL